MNSDIVSRYMKPALACNILGTLGLLVSLFVDHPLIFMLVLGLGLPLLFVGVLLWIRMVVGEARGHGLFG